MAVLLKTAIVVPTVSLCFFKDLKKSCKEEQNSCRSKQLQAIQSLTLLMKRMINNSLISIWKQPSYLSTGLWLECHKYQWVINCTKCSHCRMCPCCSHMIFFKQWQLSDVHKVYNKHSQRYKKLSSCFQMLVGTRCISITRSTKAPICWKLFKTWAGIYISMATKSLQTGHNLKATYPWNVILQPDLKWEPVL